MALFGIVITLVIAVTNRSEADARFQTQAQDFQKQTGTRLESIEKDLLSLRVEISSSQPLRSENQSAAKALLAQARRISVVIPSTVVEQAGKSFIEAAKLNKNAWSVALDYVQYRTYLNSFKFSLPNTGLIPQDTHFDIQSPTDRQPPQFTISTSATGVPIASCVS